MHTDESINAYIVGQVLAGTPYQYDPQDRHGPALAELAVPLVRLEGVKNYADLTESKLRLLPALGGAAGVLLFGAAVEFFGFIPCVMAAMLFAFAPLPLYYSRYFIHETLFVGATFGLILAGNRSFQKRAVSGAIVAGICAAFMVACKETAGLHFVTIGVAALLSAWWVTDSFSVKILFPGWLWLIALVTFLISGFLLFTWGGQNLQAPLDLVRSIPNFAARAGGEGHEKPFFYYAHLLVDGWSGAILLILAALGFWRAFCLGIPGKGGVRRFIAIYAVLITGLYSAIPYKTPWLALNFWLPLALLIGLTVEWLWLAWPRCSVRVAVVLGLLVVGILMIHDVRRRVFLDPAGENNPYAYAHTIDDVLGLPERIAQVSAAQHLAQPRIAVIAPDPWPLPWYLRKYPQTGYWQPGQDPGKADFYITTSDVPTNLNTTLKPLAYEFFGVRPNVLLLLWSPAASANTARP